MAKTGYISAQELTETISAMLTDYNEGVGNKLYRAGYRAIKDLEAKTIDTAPIGRRGRFRDYIATKSERDRLGTSTHTWYVKSPEHRLTHLLVHGHATRNGGRTKANPFLHNAWDVVREKYLKDAEEAVKNGK